MNHRNRGYKMTSQQQAAIETIENNLQMALDTFSEPHMATVDGINVALEHLVKAPIGA
jgi:hypothetical protein